jgi:hypothetical protein
MNANLVDHASDLTHSVNKIVGSYPHDIVLLVILFLIFFIFGMVRGKLKLTSLLITLYVGSILFYLFPYTKNITFVRNVSNAASWSALIVFAVIAFIVYIIVTRVILTSEGFGGSRWLHLAFLSISGITLVVGLSYGLLPIFLKLLVFSDRLTSLFNNPLGLFIAVLLPIVAIYTSNRT